MYLPLFAASKCFNFFRAIARRNLDFIAVGSYSREMVQAQSASSNLQKKINRVSNSYTERYLQFKLEIGRSHIGQENWLGSVNVDRLSI
jgi:hypothetical protein